MEMLKKVKELIGVRIKYNDNVFIINEFKLINGYYVLKTSKGIMNFLEKELLEFYAKKEIVRDNYLEKQFTNLPMKNNTSIFTYNPTEESKTLKSELMEMLKKVKENKDFIPQAQATCEIARTLVQIQKEEIQMLRLSNKI